MNFTSKIKKSTLVAFIGIISLLVFAESSIPYLYAIRATPKGNTFLGQISVTADQDMYFSFIRQAKEGNILFNNRLTCIPNKPAFINLEFWLVGALQRITATSPDAVYHLWRYLGILMLTIGITFFAQIVLPTRRQVFGCVTLLMFTGGFSFLMIALNYAHLVGYSAMHSGILDLRFGFLPFLQAVCNPHFTFPHGLILIAYAFFLLGMQHQKVRYFLMSGIMFIIIGVVRPYDIIPPFVVFPIYILAENRSLRFDLKLLAMKLLPLMMTLPVMVYNIWLFKFSSAFSGWSSQGLNANTVPAPLWHYLAFGVIGVLAVIRVLQARTNPLGATGRFLVIWFLVTFIFIHAGKYTSLLGWSPQIGTYQAAPLALLACSIAYDRRKNRAKYYSAVVIITICAIAGNITILVYNSKNFSNPELTNVYYAYNEEIAALKWLDGHTTGNDVVLANVSTSLNIAKYTAARLVAAHYSVTPGYLTMKDTIVSILSDSIGIMQKPILKRLNVTYIYIGPMEKWINDNIQIDQAAGFTMVYNNPRVAIYKVNYGF